MKFAVKDRRHLKLFYDFVTNSFDVEPHSKSGFAKIMVNDLQIEVDAVGKFLYVTGHCPLTEYEETNEAPSAYEEEDVFVSLGYDLFPFAEYRLNKEKKWPFYVNREKGWLCVGNPETKNRQLIEFAPSCIAAMEGEELVALWLHPEIPPF